MTSPGIPADVEDLLGILDEEVEVLQAKRACLEELSAALVLRDDEATERLLERLEEAERRQDQADWRLREQRQTLAERWGRPPGELKLSAIARAVPPPGAEAIELRRRRIVEAAGRLRRQHLQTVLLLRDCARINRALLESLLPESQALVTYGAGGRDTWRSDAGLVDTER